MERQATVTSIDALEAFRADLILYSERSRQCLDSARDDVRRTQLWLENDRKPHWEKQLRHSHNMLAQAEQELFSARLLELREKITAQAAAVRKWKAAVTHSEEKLALTKKWSRQFSQQAEEALRQLHGLSHFLDQDLPKAVTGLARMVRTLEGYAQSGSAMPAAATTTTPPSDPHAPAEDATPS